MSQIGVVIIGRNEGERLVRCLQSIGPVAAVAASPVAAVAASPVAAVAASPVAAVAASPVAAAAAVVYVDSGSTDGSVAAAIQAGAQIVELDMTQPFTAARARNAGRSQLHSQLPGQCAYIQFIDGDCMLQPGWLAQASAALDADTGLAAVFGRRREIAPAASVYNWLCDIEWAVPPGPARYFGGDVMLRAVALDEAGGYPDDMIAGEEPDLAMRMRKRGWRLSCLPGEMTWHDAAINRFGQFWRRAMRSGHAYGELAARHGGAGFEDYRRRLRGVLFWSLVPVAAVILLAVGGAIGDRPLLVGGAAMLALPFLQLLRLTAKGRRARNLREAFTIAAFQMLGKPAQALGIVRYWLGRSGGKRSALIEYKRSAA